MDDRTGRFTADVALQAHFSGSAIARDVQNSISGTVSNFMDGGQAVDSGWTVRLNKIQQDGTELRPGTIPPAPSRAARPPAGARRARGAAASTATTRSTTARSRRSRAASRASSPPGSSTAAWSARSARGSSNRSRAPCFSPANGRNSPERAARCAVRRAVSSSPEPGTKLPCRLSPERPVTCGRRGRHDDAPRGRWRAREILAPDRPIPERWPRVADCDARNPGPIDRRITLCFTRVNVTRYQWDRGRISMTFTRSNAPVMTLVVPQRTGA